MSTYSFGIDSPLKFELSDEYAALYNRATQAFFDAQSNHKERTGSKWTPGQPLEIDMTKEEMTAFNGFKQVLEEALKNYGKPVKENELTDDFLIKN